MSWSNVGTLIVVVLLSYEVGLEGPAGLREAKSASCVFLNTNDFPLCGCSEVVMYSYLR